jgi:hypothetical protein
MSPGLWPIALVVAAAVLAAGPARAQSDEARYSIMKPEPGTASKNSRSKSKDNPEPWLAPKYQSPRGTRERVTIPKSGQPPQQQGSKVPPLLYVPQTGRTLPNLPSPTGRETAQDRAARCAHQAGVYGQAAGDRSSYINTCINQ